MLHVPQKLNKSKPIMDLGVYSTKPRRKWNMLPPMCTLNVDVSGCAIVSYISSSYYVINNMCVRAPCLSLSHELAPSYLHNFLCKASYSYHSVNLILPRMRIDIYKSRFSFLGPHAWNSLSSKLKQNVPYYFPKTIAYISI